MAYYNPYQPPYPYQDQLNHLRNAPVPMAPQRPDSSGVLWVQGEAGAKSWIVSPGSTVLLMDSEAMRFYLKSADLSGVPSLRAFEYTEIVQNQPKAPEIPAEKFVTREEFDRFVQSLTQKAEVTDDA